MPLPELPEAEIARRQLARWVGAEPIRAIRLEDPAVVRTHLSSRPSDAVDEPEVALRPLIGSVATGFRRHGKRIALVTPGLGVLVHLGMSGKLVRSEEVPRYGRVGLVTSGTTVWLVDRRRFGCLVPVAPASIDPTLRQGHGPDALEEAVSAEALAARLTGRRAVKVALLDQQVLAGIGNIQAVEILFRAGVDPRTRCDALTSAQHAALATVIPRQLREVVEAEDGGEITYVTDGGENVFRVYGHADEPCPACGEPIASLRQSGRSTFWCPGCQR